MNRLTVNIVRISDFVARNKQIDAWFDTYVSKTAQTM